MSILFGREPHLKSIANLRRYVYLFLKKHRPKAKVRVFFESYIATKFERSLKPKVSSFAGPESKKSDYPARGKKPKSHPCARHKD